MMILESSSSQSTVDDLTGTARSHQVASCATHERSSGMNDGDKSEQSPHDMYDDASVGHIHKSSNTDLLQPLHCPRVHVGPWSYALARSTMCSAGRVARQATHFN